MGMPLVEKREHAKASAVVVVVVVVVSEGVSPPASKGHAKPNGLGPMLPTHLPSGMQRPCPHVHDSLAASSQTRRGRPVGRPVPTSPVAKSNCLTTDESGMRAT